MKKIILTLPLLAISCLLANPDQTKPHPPKTPPQKAIDACKNQESGASCSITTPRGDTLEGSCQNTPDNKYFACVPKDHKPPKQP